MAPERSTDASLTEAHRLVESDPVQALRTSRLLVAHARDDDVRSAALRVVGLAAARLGHNRDALSALRRAVRIADAAGLAHRAALARLTLVVVHAAAGDFEAALTEADLAAEVLRGRERGELLAQRGVVLGRIGRYGEALECFGSALRHLTSDADATWRARVYHNRGYLHTLRGNMSRAELDFNHTIALCRELGLAAGEAITADNLGLLFALKGDIPAALGWLDRAEQIRRSIGMSTVPTLLDRAETLLAAGLAGEARTYAAEAVDALTASRRAADLAEARLTLARCALADGDAGEALRAAERARRAFTAQGRPAWEARARLEATRARWATGERGPRLIKPALDAARALDAAGWSAAAIEARVLAGRALVERGARTEATNVLGTAGRARSHGTADLRARAWHAEAVLRQAHGDSAGAVRALRAGLRVVDEHAAVLGATELRAHAGVLGLDLAQLGLHLALQSGQPERILEWRELFRASVLRRRPVRPPRDRALAADLTELRRIAATVQEQGVDDAADPALRAEQRRLEQAVRDRMRRVGGARAPGAPSGGVRFRCDELVDALGARALIEFAYADGALHAVTVAGGRVRHEVVAQRGDVLAEAESLRFSLHRLARRHGSAASLELAAASARHAAEQLDAALLAPLARELADRELVVVPTMALHALPWAVLPSLRGRPVSVAPSATSWLRAAHAPRRRGAGIVLAAGPGLAHAATEVASIAAHYAGSTQLVGVDASADAVRRALDGARLAHLACHGEFRADNPQFSALHLADGPLMVYDLEGLRRAPELIVLSACDAGLSAVRPGDELMGLTAALLALGTRTIVASVAPVHDEAAKSLMIDFHRRLAAGDAPAAALAASQTALEVAGFTCFGVG